MLIGIMLKKEVQNHHKSIFTNVVKDILGEKSYQVLFF
jgi:hypothetical protein